MNVNADVWFRLAIFFIAIQPIAVLAKNDPVFEFEMTGPDCTTICEIFVINIYNNGIVHYRGNKILQAAVPKQHVRIVGDRYAKLTKSQLHDLVKTFEALPLDEINKHVKPFDVGSYVVKFKRDSSKVEFDFAPYFRKMIDKVDEFVGLRRWICFPPETKGHETCLI
jgi:hypothetical protein